MACLEIRVLHETPAITIAAAGPYCLGRWRDVSDVHGLRAMHEALLIWARSVDRFCASNVVDAHAIIRIPEDGRREVAKVQGSFNDQQAGLATVVPAKGFFSAAVRGIVSAVVLMSRARFPQQVFDDQRAARLWSAGLIGRTDGDDALAALATLEPQQLRAAQ